MAATHQILGRTPAQFTELAVGLGLPKYTGWQIANWLHQKHVSSWDEMINLSKEACALPASHYEIGRTTSHLQQTSRDGTVRYLFAADGGFVETVMIPEGNHVTFCVSSQRGCKMNCLFCTMGKRGFGANPSTDEILNQILSVFEVNGLTDIVFIRTNEPVDNIDAFLQAITRLTDPQGPVVSPKRVIASTTGLRPGLERFLEECACHLIISLHNPLSEERPSIMPVERAMSLTDTVALLRHYDWNRQRRLTFEYIVFSELSDTPRHLAALKRLLTQLDCHVNLIRYHRTPHIDLPSSDVTCMEWLRDWLCEADIPTTIRTPRDEDISTACGTLNTREQQGA